MAAGGSQQETSPSRQSLEYLKDASQISIQAALFGNNKYLLLIAENSVTHCCTISGSPDVVIRDRRHTHIRFCISGAALGLPVIKSYVQSKHDKIGKIKGSHMIIQSRLHGAFVEESSATDCNNKYVYLGEENQNRLASILVSDRLITVKMNICLPTSVKALVISFAVMLALSKHRNRVVDFMGPPLNSEECARLLPACDTCKPLTCSEQGSPTKIDFNLPVSARLIIKPFTTNATHRKYTFVLMNAARNNEVCMTLVYYKRSGRLDCIEPFGSVIHSAKKSGCSKSDLKVFTSPSGRCWGFSNSPSASTTTCTSVELVNLEREDDHPNRLLKFLIQQEDRFYFSYPIINANGEEIIKFTTVPGYATLDMHPCLHDSEKLLAIMFSLKYYLKTIEGKLELPCLQCNRFSNNYFAYKQWQPSSSVQKRINDMFARRNNLHLRGSAFDPLSRTYFVDCLSTIPTDNDLIYKVKCQLNEAATELVLAEVRNRTGVYTMFYVKYYSEKNLITVHNDCIGHIGYIDNNVVYDRAGIHLADMQREPTRRDVPDKFVSYLNDEPFCTIHSIMHSTTVAISSKKDTLGWIMKVLYFAFAIKECFSTYKFSQIPLPMVSSHPNREYLDDSDIDED
ncbi:hypothetical protein EB796_003288 [Bugula neritina]|uniref:Uncharacterized protein n=1 Tax=Bugula neritina TaxID=10212 RepID=A0A7J7KJD7_BUGNE|nr:hypothetical protein EB796_003288 [Bugula neritina]